MNERLIEFFLVKNASKDSFKVLIPQVTSLVAATFLVIASLLLYINQETNAAHIGIGAAFVLVIGSLSFYKDWLVNSNFTAAILLIAFILWALLIPLAKSNLFVFVIYPMIAISCLRLTKGSIYVILMIVAIFVINFFALSTPIKIELLLYFLTAYIFTATVTGLAMNFLTNERDVFEKNKIIKENDNKLKDEIFSRLSHQIRTPLNNILVVSNMINKEELDDKLKELISTISTSTNNLVNVVNDITKISDIDFEEKKTENINFDLYNTIQNTLDYFKGESDSSALSINMVFQEKIDYFLLGDPVRLKQIFLNLIENILVAKDSRPLIIDIVIGSKSNTKNSMTIEFMIRCNMSLPVDSSDKASFDDPQPDFSIARKLIEIAKSEFNITSSPSQSEISFSLDFKRASTQTSIPTGQGASKKMSSKMSVKLEDANILLVEDNLVNQKIVNLSLKKLVANIDIANNGKEALDQFGTTKYDLILMDVQMPVMDGITATKKIREIETSTNTHTPIIAITANALAGDKENCLSAGMNEYISKPFQIEDLVDKMKSLLTID